MMSESSIKEQIIPAVKYGSYSNREHSPSSIEQLLSYITSFIQIN